MVLSIPEAKGYGLIESRVTSMHHVYVPLILPCCQGVKVDGRVLQLILWGTIHVPLVIFCDVLVRVEVHTPNDFHTFTIMKVQLFRIAHLPSVILLVPRVPQPISLLEILYREVLSEELHTL